MKADKFFYILKCSGITIEAFAQSINKSRFTLDNWKYQNQEIKTIYINHLQQRITKEAFRKHSIDFDRANGVVSFDKKLLTDFATFLQKATEYSIDHALIDEFFEKRKK